MAEYFLFFMGLVALCLIGYCIDYHIRSKPRKPVPPPYTPPDTGNYNLYDQRTSNNALYYKQYKRVQKTTKS